MYYLFKALQRILIAHVFISGGLTSQRRYSALRKGVLCKVEKVFIGWAKFTNRKDSSYILQVVGIQLSVFKEIRAFEKAKNFRSLWGARCLKMLFRTDVCMELVFNHWKSVKFLQCTILRSCSRWRVTLFSIPTKLLSSFPANFHYAFWIFLLSFSRRSILSPEPRWNFLREHSHPHLFRWLYRPSIIPSSHLLSWKCRTSSPETVSW